MGPLRVTWKGHGEVHGKSWNFQTLEEYKPWCSSANGHDDPPICGEKTIFLICSSANSLWP